MKDENKILHRLYEELVKLQKEIISSNLKLLVILDGRDAAGKDGTIKRITKHLSPRETKIVALAKPSDRQSLEWYFQRYVAHLHVSGEIVIFNRSWYNRAGVEKVMGFCTDEEYKTFFTQVSLFEEMLVNAGFIILKYYLDISKKEQEKRLLDRKENPLKQWKVSPIDDQAQHYWKEYSDARDKMLSKTDFKHAPWFIVKADDKSKTHIGMITHLLAELEYSNKDKKLLSNNYGKVFAANGKNIADNLY